MYKFLYIPFIILTLIACNKSEDSGPDIIVAQDGSFIEINGSRQRLNANASEYSLTCEEDGFFDIYTCVLEYNPPIPRFELGQESFDLPLIISIAIANDDLSEGTFALTQPLQEPNVYVSDGNAVVTIGGIIGKSGEVVVEKVNSEYAFRFDNIEFENSSSSVSFSASGQLICE